MWKVIFLSLAGMFLAGMFLAGSADAGCRGGRILRGGIVKKILHRATHPLEGIRERRAGACDAAPAAPAAPAKTMDAPKRLP